MTKPQVLHSQVFGSEFWHAGNCGSLSNSRTIIFSYFSSGRLENPTMRTSGRASITFALHMSQ
jgi:hypothetical protein